MSNFIGLRTMVLRLVTFRSFPLSLEEKLRWAFLWRITIAFRCFNFYVKIFIFHGARLKTVSLDFFSGSKWGFGEVEGRSPSQKTLQNHENQFFRILGPAGDSTMVLPAP